MKQLHLNRRTVTIYSVPAIEPIIPIILH